MAARTWSHIGSVALCVAVWWTNAFLVTLFMKLTLGSTHGTEGYFPYPVALTGMTNFGAVPAALVLDFVMHGCSMKKAVRSLQLWDVGVLVMLGVMNGIEFGLNNLAVMYLQVALRTMVLSSSVLFSMITCWLWGLELCGVGKMFSLVFLIAGGLCQGLSVGENGLDVESQIVGCLLQVVSIIISCQRWAGLQWIMQRLDPESALRSLSKMQLMIAMSVVSGPQCLALSVFLEGPEISKFNIVIVSNVAIISSAIVVMVAAELQLLHLTSAVAVAVLSPLHTIPIIIGGVVLFHDQILAINVAGFCLSLFGACVYAFARHREKQEAQPLVSPRVASGADASVTFSLGSSNEERKPFTGHLDGEDDGQELCRL